jgi:hypothetical protein
MAHQQPVDVMHTTDGETWDLHGPWLAGGRYIRSTDDALMIEVKPHQFVNAAAVRALGLREER